MAEKKRRTKPVKAKTIAHPLQRFLGTFMRLERLRQRRSAPELAAAMKLSPGYIKMLESGAVPLNIAIADVFIDEMRAQHTEAVRDQRVILFDRLTRYLAGSHWLAAQLGANEAKGASATVVLKAMGALKDQDPLFQRLHDLVARYVMITEESAEREFLETEAAPEVDAFLRKSDYGVAAPDVGAVVQLLNDLGGYFKLAGDAEREEFVQLKALPALEMYFEKDLRRKLGAMVQMNEELLSLQDFLSMPSMNVDLLLDIKEALIDRPFVHTTYIAAKWEIKNYSKFRYTRGVYSKPSVIINQNNLDLFRYWYLGDSRFKEVQFIFIQADELGSTEPALRAKFVELLNKGRRNAGQAEELSPGEIEKIRIVCLNASGTNDPRVTKLLEPLDEGMAPYDAYWSFETHKDLDIGFVGLTGNNTDNIRNLSLRDSIARNVIFEQLWKDVEQKR